MRSSVFLQQWIESGKKDVGKYFAWNWQKGNWAMAATLIPRPFPLYKDSIM